MKKILSFLMSAIFAFSILSVNVVADNDEIMPVLISPQDYSSVELSGVYETVEISTPQQLVDFAQRVNGGGSDLYINAVLKTDIDLAGEEIQPIGKTQFYKGTFDGGNFCINNLTINADGASAGGLFGFCSGSIINLTVSGFVCAANAGGIVGENRGTISGVTSNVSVIGSGYVGGIAAVNKGVISSCTTSKYVRGSNKSVLGGIAGYNQNIDSEVAGGGKITDCTNKSFVQGEYLMAQMSYPMYAGGIAGMCTPGTLIKDCLNYAKVSGAENIGGITGVSTASIDGCINYADIDCYNRYAGGIAGCTRGTADSIANSKNYGTINAASYIGGIAGTTTQSIIGCENFGDIPSSTNYAGGIIGKVESGSIDSCKNMGNISATGAYTGGIAGLCESSIANCHNFGVIVGKDHAAGIVGLKGANNKVSGCTNSGNVTGVYKVGGIAGETYSEVSQCINTGDIKGFLEEGTNANDCGGIVGLFISSTSILHDCLNVGTVTKNTGYYGGSIVGRCYSPISDCASYTKSILKIKGAGSSDAPVNCFTLDSNTEQEFANGTILALLNADRTIWKQSTLYPVPVDTVAAEATGAYVALNTPDTSADPEIVSAVVEAADNDGISYDVFPTYNGAVATFFIPSSADISSVVYRTINKSGERSESLSLDTSGNGYITLDGYKFKIAVYKSQLPSFYLNVDESHGTIKDMNSSYSHSIKCYGDFRVDVPQALQDSRGFSSSYKSKEGKEKSPGSMEMKGRGNSTWNISPFAQKPYQLKSEKKVDMFGMGAAKTWLLIRTNQPAIYNKLGLDTGIDMNIKYTPQSEFVDVFMNGSYIGLYLVTEKVEVDPERVNITDLDDAYAEEPENADMTGGYLVELDNNSDVLQFKINSNGVPNTVTVKSPEELEENETATATNNYSYIVNKITELFDAIYGDGLMKDGSFFMDHIDIEDFARYYWQQEFIANTDCGRGSTYLYKDTDSIDPIIHTGPVWDSDAAFYSPNAEKWRVASLHSTDASTTTPRLFNALMQWKEFASYVVWYYENTDVKSVFEHASEHVTEYEALIPEAVAMQRIKWGYDAPSYSGVRDFLNKRSTWIEKNYSTLTDRATKGSVLDIDSENSEFLRAVNINHVRGTITAQLNNTSDTDVSPLVIITAYKDGEIADVKVKRFEGLEKKSKKNISLAYPENFDSLKIRTWDMQSQLKPFHKSVEYK